MAAEVICLANFKGGVGKSTTAINLAVGLARSGQRTLLVDCDPQANASEMFIPENEILSDLRSIIKDQVPVSVVIRLTRVEGLDLLPATFDLAYLDKELVVTPSGMRRIDRALRPVLDNYDFIVLDTGPNLSHLTLGALAACQHIIIPVSSAVWSTTGLRKFMRWIEENQNDEVISARLLGLVATIVPFHTRIGRAVLEELDRSPLPSFKTFIPRRIAAEDNAMDRLVAGDPDADPALTGAYLSFTDEVISRVAQLAATPQLEATAHV